MKLNQPSISTSDRWKNVPRFSLMAFFGVLLLVLWSVVGWGIQRSHAYAESMARRELSNLSWAFAETVEAAVKTLDIATQDLRDDWLNQPEHFTERVAAKQKRLAQEMIFQVGVIGADGHMQFSSLDPNASPVDLSDRAHFQVHKNRHSDQLFISAPVLGRVSKRWSLQFTRPIFDPEGRFAGVIVISVASDHFTRHYETLNFQTDSASTLIDQHGHVLARWPAPEGAIGSRFEMDQLKGAMPSKDQGWLEQPSALDQVNRLSIWRKVTGQDLYVVLGLATDSVFAAHRLQRNAYLLAGVGGSIFLALVGLLLANMLRSNERTNQALRISEERWNLALESGEFTVWDLNPRTGQVFRLSRSSEIFGDEAQDIEASTDEWASRLHPQDLSRTLELVQACLSGAQNRYVTEYRVRATDGSWRWALDRGMVIGRNKAGQALRMIGTLSDITTRRQAQQQLMDSQLFLRTLTDALPSLVGYWRADMTCSFANLAYQNFFQRNADAMQDVPLKVLLGEPVFQKQRRYFEGALAGHAQMFELECPHRDGNLRIFWTQYLPDLGTGGQVQGVFALLTDVSSVKAAQTRLERLNRQLQERAASSSADVTIELPSAPGLKISKRNLETQPFQLAALVEDTAATLLSRAREKSVALHVAVSSTIPGTVVGDPATLRQILTHLLSNAITFTEQGAVSLDVALVSLNDKTVKLQFDVRDSGVGINPSQHASIFEPVWQETHALPDGAPLAHNPTETSMSLSLSRALVASMQGHLWVASSPGLGSTFSFTIKLGVHNPAAVQPPTPGVSLAVLLVDDYPLNQTYAAGLLEFLGHRVTLANDGQEAVEWASKKAFDLVLMDLQMPVMDGLEATRQIRMNEATRGSARVRIVAMTAFVVQSEVDQCLAAGMDDFVAKPFSPEDLAKHLTPLVATIGNKLVHIHQAKP